MERFSIHTIVRENQNLKNQKSEVYIQNFVVKFWQMLKVHGKYREVGRYQEVIEPDLE